MGAVNCSRLTNKIYPDIESLTHVLPLSRHVQFACKAFYKVLIGSFIVEQFSNIAIVKYFIFEHILVWGKLKETSSWRSFKNYA